MSKLRNYYISVRLSDDDFERHGVLDVDGIEAPRGSFARELESVRDDLAEREIQSAEIVVLDYTDDDEGEEVHEEDFDLDEYAPDVSEAEADAALAKRDPDLHVAGRDPGRDHKWKVGRYIDDQRAFVNVVWRKSLREIVAWAEDDRNFTDRDAA